MSGIKRKSDGVKATKPPKAKKLKSSPEKELSKSKKKSKSRPVAEPEELVESDDTEDEEHGYYGSTAKGESEVSDKDDEVQSDSDVDMEDGGIPLRPKSGGQELKANGTKNFANGAVNASSSKEAHAKQKALAKERKAAKPGADLIQRAKKLWERLRRKSHVPKDERKELVKELFEIVTGRVNDFVFKHDSVRVIQCAIKYANPDQKKMIAKELKGNYRALAESRYAKFLVGKLLVEGGDEVRDLIVPEFYGHVRRLINHPEASWILDDIYRGVATPKQKANMLREWYGPEFAIFRAKNDEDLTADLSEILTKTPEKRKPIMEYAQALINQLIQKKMTGFTILHDAMLQYFLNTKPCTEEANEFLELLKGDEEGDLLKNLAFTKSGSRVACLALAYGTAKDRKNILKVYKDNIEMLAYDTWGHQVLLAAYDVIDDTKLTSKAIFPELTAEKKANKETQESKLLEMVNHITGRVALLYPLAGDAKWLLSKDDQTLIAEVHKIRETTSKKDPEVRRKELCQYISKPVLALVAAHASTMVQSGFGCQFIGEVVLATEGDKSACVEAVAETASGECTSEDHVAQLPYAGRMINTLVQGGRYDHKTKTTIPLDPPLGFADALYPHIEDHVIDWACGPSSFVVVNLLEVANTENKGAILKALKKNKKAIQKAATEPTSDQKAKQETQTVKEAEGNGKKPKGKKVVPPVGNAGSKLLLAKL